MQRFGVSLKTTDSAVCQEIAEFSYPLFASAVKGSQAPNVGLLGAEVGLSNHTQSTVTAVGAVVVLAAFMKSVSMRTSFTSKTSSIRYVPDRKASIIAWIKDGVVVETEELFSQTMGAFIAASAEDLKTDISGF